MIAATMFSGIGAPEVAMPHWDWRWCAEIEKFPSAVLRHRHPKSVNLGDINAEDFVARAKSVGRPDVLVFGSPCQDFSVAGRRVGLDGDRGNLALVALGIVNQLRPRWVVFENVPGLLSSRSGSAAAESSLRDRIEHGTGRVGESSDGEEDSDFAAFLALVQQCGYFGCYRITDAQYAGVPQRRRRVFAVFHLGDWRPAAAVLFEPEGLRGDRPPSRETGEGITGTISSRPAGSGGLGTDFDLAGGLVESAGKQPFAFDEIAPTLRSVPTAGKSHGKLNGSDRMPLIGVPDGPVGAVSSKWSKGSGGPAGDECYNLIPVRPIAFTSKDYGGDAAIEQSPTLRAMEFDGSHANGGGQVAVAFQTRIARNGRGSDAGGSSRSYVALQQSSRNEIWTPDGGAIVGALSAESGSKHTNYIAETAVRRLTPRECERLQAFEDDYTLIRYRGAPAADGPRYKALGNAMNVKEVQWVLQRIERFEREVR